MTRAKQAAEKTIELDHEPKAPPPPRKHVVRQDRLSIPDFRAFLVIDGHSFPIINYSAFGLAISSQRPFAEDFKCERADLMVEGFHVQTVSIVRVRDAVQPDESFKTAFEVYSESIQMEKLAALPEILRVTLAMESEMEHYAKLPLPFVAKVYELKDLLSKANDKISEMHQNRSFTSRQEVDDFEKTVIDVVGTSLHRVLTATNNQLAHALEGQPEQTVKSCYQFFRDQLKAGVYQSTFAKRSLNKPLGYPGDYEMMNIIYRNEDFGQSLFGRCIERAFVGHDEPQAVRNRTDYIKDKIASLLERAGTKKIRALSVGSGPAREVQLLIEQLDQATLDRFEVELMDQDVAALKYAQRQIKKLALKHKKTVHVTFTQQNIKTVLLKGVEANHYDLIYSMGLFDYFSDQVARLAGKQLFAGLKSKGTMVIGNFDVGCPHKIGMEIVFDWSLIYRSKSELAALLTLPDSKSSIESEANGINIFCVTEKQ